MKHYLFYGCTDRYERGPLELLKSILVRDNSNAPDAELNAVQHEEHFKKYFAAKEYSCLYILVLNLDPQSGITEVIRNEYAENPLKTRIVINAAAKPATFLKRSRSALDQMIMAQESTFSLFDAVQND